MVGTSMLETKKMSKGVGLRRYGRPHRAQRPSLLADYGNANLPVSSVWPAERPTSTSKSPGSAFHWWLFAS